MRKLASIKQINAITPIPGADFIECATVGGWKVVVPKGEFTQGDYGIYFEIDSWIPFDLAPHLSKGQEPKEYNGVLGTRLRTVKLKGQVSQGLLLPTNVLGIDLPSLDSDLANLLGIQKYEPPIPACLAGEMRGAFPSFIQKTDQERIQNLSAEFEDIQQGQWEITEKLDGASMTVYVNGGDEGVCSRNINLKETEGNTFWKIARKQELIEELRALGRDLAIQGELIGEGVIKGNPYKIKGQRFFLFDVFDIKQEKYLSHEDRLQVAAALGVLHVPIISYGYSLSNPENPAGSMDALIRAAADESRLAPSVKREGLVFKALDGSRSFKVISNAWLLKEK